MKELGRRHFTAALAGSLAWPLLAQARDTALPIPASLPKVAAQAAVRGEPLVLLVSLTGCPYCELVRRNYLLPARKEAGLQAWQLNVTDFSTPLTGFDGKVTSAAAQTKAWKATFTPTVLFLGPQGQTLAEPLVGAAIPDFYGAYLDERLVLARRAVVALR
ncbi:hypothetical protein [Polaromonas sp. YR568]|uniref:hypothetical protein n=1 Tax=Polaromonas sp. YR568 TaxID=1855301 RepID=UPI00398BD8DD